MRLELFSYLCFIFNAWSDKHSETVISSKAISKWIKIWGNYSILVLWSQNILTISPFQLTWKLKQHFPVNLTMMQPLGASGVPSMFVTPDSSLQIKQNERERFLQHIRKVILIFQSLHILVYLYPDKALFCKNWVCTYK